MMEVQEAKQRIVDYLGRSRSMLDALDQAPAIVRNSPAGKEIRALAVESVVLVKELARHIAAAAPAQPTDEVDHGNEE